MALMFQAFSSGTPVEIARTTRGDVREYIDEEGKTRLAQIYGITAPYTGRVEAIDLNEGDQVSKGQIVARIVPLDSALNVASARAAVDRLEASIKENDDVTVETTTLEQAINFVDSMDRTVEAAAARVRSGEAKFDYAKKHLDRVERLFSNKSMAENELDQARVSEVQSGVDHEQDLLVLRAIESLRAATALMPTAVRQYIQRKTLSRDVLEKQLAEARVNLQAAERDQARGEMASPVDGVVLERADSNERQFTAGNNLLKIGRWEELEIEADVLSQELAPVKPGSAVEVSGPAIGPRPVVAHVTRIYPAGFTKISSLGVEQQRVKVVMRFSAADLARLRTEQGLGVDYRVRVRIFTAEHSQTLSIPRSALFRGADGGWRVFAIVGGHAELRSVSVGLGNDERAEITAGLAENDEVVVAPETNLADGQSVRIIDRH
jgi:HlyD family secretion protein